MSISASVIEKVKQKAESYYKNGDYYCSEAIIRAVKDEFNVDISDRIIAMASGFPVGIGGSGCTCGALNGGVMAIGLFFGRETAKDPCVNHAMQLSKELHDDFKMANKSTCCRVLTKGLVLGSDEHMKKCIRLTGEVAENTAAIIFRELEKT
jgi:C_GCAxxG_C_C family probable redox protein